jgi:hypothetical protein
LATIQEHTDLLTSVIQNPLAVASIATAIGGTLIGGDLGKVLGIGGQVGFATMVAGSLSVMKRHQYISI